MITELGVAEDGRIVLRNTKPEPMLVFEARPLGRCHHQGRVPTMTVNRTLVTPGPSPKNELGLFSTGFLSFYPIRWFVKNCWFESNRPMKLLYSN